MLRWCQLAAFLLCMALLAGADDAPLQYGLTSEGASEQCTLSMPNAFVTKGQKDALDPLESRNKEPSMAQQASGDQRP